MAEEEMDALRDRLNAVTELAKELFEQQFIRCEGGRMPADPEWEDLELAEREEWESQALDARPLIERAGQGRDLLLWLHAEAVWNLSLACGECHCVTDEQAATLAPGFSRPVCTVHPGGTE